MKRMRSVSYLLILSFIISIIFVPSVSLAAANPTSNYETFSYGSSDQSGVPPIDPKVFLPKGWHPDTPDQYMPRTPSTGENGAKNIVGAAPAVPTGLAVTKTTNNSITIKWNKVSGAKKYSIFVSTKKDSGYKAKGSAKGTSFTVKGLKKDKTYYIKVCAENGKQKSAQSEYTMGKATTKPGVVTVLTATPIDAHAIQLQWNKAANTTYYEVYTSEDGGDFEYMGKTTALGAYIDELDYDTDYCFGIIACNKAGATAGGVVYCNTLRYPAPTGLTAQVVEDNKAQLAWTGVSGATEYNIYYAYDGDTEYKYYGSTASTSYTTAGLNENCNCYFVVCADFDGDESDISNEAAITTRYVTPEAPSISLAQVSGIDHIYLRWSYISKATDYHIYISPTAEGPYTLLQRPVSTATTYTLYEIIPSTDYYFKVTALNHSAESALSPYQHVLVDGVPSVYTPLEDTYSHKISISWFYVYGATRYNIYVSNEEYGTYKYLASTSSTSYDYEGYAPKTKYYFCVTSENSYGYDSDWSNPVSITTK